MFKSCLPIKDANDDDDDDCNEDNYYNNNYSSITATITPNSSSTISVLKFNTKIRSITNYQYIK